MCWGTKGVLIYAGYNINELAGKASYEEIVYLLWHGVLPNRAATGRAEGAASKRARTSEGSGRFHQGRSDPRKSNGRHPHGGFHAGSLRQRTQRGSEPSKRRPPPRREHHGQDRRDRRLFSPRPPGALASRQCGRISDEAAHFLYLLNGEEPSTEAAKTLDVAYVLHADHGMNASTFSARVTIATLSDIYSAITSAIGTLKGPLHGGANEGVIHMLLEIGSEDKVDAWVEEQLAQKKKIMGIGHRVYKVLDPRAPHLRAMAVKLCEELGEPKWIRMSERIAAKS